MIYIVLRGLLIPFLGTALGSFASLYQYEQRGWKGNLFSCRCRILRRDVFLTFIRFSSATYAHV